MKKVPATFEVEQSLWKKELNYVVGLDEVGRGALAGPLVAAAVIFPKDYRSPALFFDSKLLTAENRQILSDQITKDAFSFAIGQVEVVEIEKMGLAKANQIAFFRALEKLVVKPDHYLVDAFYLKFINKVKQTPIVHGDQFSASIAAASIVAKVYRDKLMTALALTYPKYNFDLHKGYGTKFHQEAIKNLGLTKIHRKNYHLKFLNDQN